MSADRAIALKAELRARLDREVPLPATLEEWQDRLYGLTDALADELAAWLRWRHPGVDINDDFAIQEFSLFAVDMLIPFALASVRERVRPTTERRH